MADEKTGGGKGSLLGSVWIKLGLKMDDLKAQLREARKEVANAFQTDPVKDLKEETQKVEKVTEELKQELEKVKKEVKEAYKPEPVEDLKEEVKEVEEVTEDLKDELKKTGKEVEETFDPAPVEDFNEEEEETKKNTSDLTESFGSLLKTVLAVFAVKNVADFLNECEDLIQFQQYAEQRLATTMQNRFNSTQAEIDAVSELANKLEAVTGISDELTLSGANTLATYVESAETVKGMLSTMHNIANSRFGLNEISAEDFADIGKTIGEAFAEGGLEPLKGLNIAITAEDSEAFSTLTTEAERMAYIVELVNTRIGSINSSLSDTLTIDRRLSTTTNELKETVGSMYQVFIVPIKNMVLSIAETANTALTSLANILGVKMVQAENATNKAASSTANYFKSATKEAEKTKRALLGIDEIQKLNLSDDEETNTASSLDSGINTSTGAITQAVQFEYEEGSFADRISEALGKIGQGIATYIGDKFGIAFDETTIENFVSKLEELGTWIEEHPDEFANLIDSAGKFIAVIAGFSIISGAIGWIGKLATAMVNLGSLFSSIGSVLANPWSWVVIALTAVVAVFWMARDSIAEAFETLIDFISDPMRYVSYLVDIGDAVFSWFLELLGSIFSSLWDWMKGVGQSIADWWNGLWDGKDGTEIQAQLDTSWTTTAAGVPPFATGGFVGANTPTLAIVGDNRKQGEFVLTEQQFAEAANKYGNGGDNSELLAVAKAILEAILGLELTTKFDLDALAEYVITYAQKKQRATGRSVI